MKIIVIYENQYTCRRKLSFAIKKSYQKNLWSSKMIDVLILKNIHNHTLKMMINDKKGTIKS